MGGESRWDMSLMSRFAKETFVYTSPKRDARKFIEDVNRYCREFRANCVFPTSEAGIMACSEHRKELVCEPIIPTEREIETIFSKAKTLALAQSLGIAVPRTFHVTDDTVCELDTIALKLPVAIKSESSEVMLSGRAATSSKTAYASTRAEAVAECRARLAKADNPFWCKSSSTDMALAFSGLFHEEGRPGCASRASPRNSRERSIGRPQRRCGELSSLSPACWKRPNRFFARSRLAVRR